MTLPIIGSYRLMRTIGEGEFGKVKLAVHIETGVEVAIKLCKKSQVVATPNGYTKLMREISTLKLVKNHPFIITLIEVIENETYIAIVMELAKGGELFEHILTKRSLEENETRKLFAQIMSAVGYIHSLEIVHRDLKLENILLDEHQNVVLIDFGFANKTKGPDVLMRTSCGSPCYAAPELVTTEGYIGEKADLWSCGVILFSMIAGYLPWDDDPDNPEGDNINLLYNYIMHTPLDFPDHVPYDCRLLINRILEPNPDKRADIEEIINHVWLQPVKHIFDAEMDRRKNLVANIPIGPGSGSLNSPKLSPTRSSSIAVEQQVPMPAIQGDTSMEASSLPVTPKRGNSGSSTPMIVEQLGISTITPPPTPGSKRVVPADPRVSPISSPTAPIASLSIPYAPNARSTSLVVGEIYGNSERTVSEAETMVAGDDIGSVNPATPGVVVSDRIVVDEPSSFEPAGIQAHSGHHVVDSYSTVANEAMVVDEDQPVYLPKNEKGPQSDIVTDLRGMLTTLSSDNKTLPTTPEVSILKQEERDLSSEITTSSSTDISHNRSKHESRELHPSSFAEFMRKAMDRPLPDLPPEADEISEPRGILRGFTTPLISNDDSSRGSSTKKRVSIQEPSLTLANGNRSSSRASWLSSLTSKLFGKSAEPEALSRDTSAVGVQGRADPLSASKRSSATYSIFPFRSTSRRSTPVSPTPGVFETGYELPPIPTEPGPRVTQSPLPEPQRARNLLSGFFGGLVTTPRATSPNRRQDSQQSNMSRAQTPLSWYATSRPSTPLTTRDIQRTASGRVTPAAPDMARSDTVLSLSASDYHVHFSNRSRGSLSSRLGSRMNVVKSMRVHVGNTDVRAISRRDPETLLEDLRSMLEQRGFEVLQSGQVDIGEYRLKVVQPGTLSRVSPADKRKEGVVVSALELATFMDIPDELLMPGDSDTIIQLSPAVSRTISKHEKLKQSSKFGRALAGVPQSWLKKVRYVKEYGMRYNSGFDPKVNVNQRTSAAVGGSESTADDTVPSRDKLQFVDEIVFYVELQKVANVPGVCVVDFKRVRGNIWQFKRLYNGLIEALPVV